MTAKAAVVGCPIKHSLSPELFQELGALMGRAIEYRAIELPPDKLAEAFAKAKSDGTVGWNVTLPHKIHALDLADEVDAGAAAIGAANVLSFGPSVKAFNTDAAGFLAPLAREGFSPFGHRAVVFGAGGAARAVLWALATSNVADLVVVNRDADRGKQAAEAFGARALTPAAEELASVVERADLVVNATSVGMDGASTPVPAQARMRSGAYAYDLIYRPRRTPFLKTAQDQGAETFDGLPMLVAQAAAAWKIWFGEAVPADAQESAAAAMARRLE